MFSWIRHYTAEVCALLSALLVLAVFIMFSILKKNKSEYKADTDRLCIFSCFDFVLTSLYSGRKNITLRYSCRKQQLLSCMQQ